MRFLKTNNKNWRRLCKGELEVKQLEINLKEVNMVIVEGTIKGKARPRVFGKHAVTPEDTVSYENWVKINYQQQDGRCISGPVKATINVYHMVPKSCTKKRLKAIREGLDYPQKKPDVDNIAKIILDSLNGIAYKDDSQVVELAIIKRWTEEQERVEFELQEVE